MGAGLVWFLLGGLVGWIVGYAIGRSKKKKGRVIITVGPVEEIQVAQINVNLTTNQRALILFDYRDSASNPAPVDGEPIFEVVAGDSVSWDTNAPPTNAPNLKQAWLTRTGLVGDYTARVTADADMGGGFEPIPIDVAGTVTHPKAANVSASVVQIEEIGPIA